MFEVVSSAGKKIGDSPEGKLVEFETHWRGKQIKTIEAVSLEPPVRIGYRWVEGPLDQVEEEIVFEARAADVTLMRYAGRIAGARGLTGWLRTVLIVRPIFNRLVREHLVAGKEMAEKRARRSHVHPRQAPER